MNKNTESVALVVHSGGQDSTTALGVARMNHGEIHTVSFSYGQRHDVELKKAEHIADLLGVVSHQEIHLPLGGLVTSNLTNTDGDVGAKHPRMTNLPASFVPNRNALFLTVAHALAQELGTRHVYAGMCQTDYSGYPDCRIDFIRGLQGALNVGYEANVQFHTPIMFIDKADTFRLAEECGILTTVIYETHTCYNGDRSNVEPWGRGCGSCPACKLRAAGWETFLDRTATGEYNNKSILEVVCN